MNDNYNNTGSNENNSNQQNLGNSSNTPQNQAPQRQVPPQNQQPPYQNNFQNPPQYRYTNNYGQQFNAKKTGVSTGGLVAITLCAITAISIIIIVTIFSGLAFIGIIEKNIESDLAFEDSYFEEAADKTDGFYGKVFTLCDGSSLYLNDNGTYIWYKNKNIKNDNYFEGTFDVTAGDNAADTIVNELSSYGVTIDELNSFYEMNEGSGYIQENLICIVMTCETRIVNKVDVSEGNDTVAYMGFYNGDDYTLANMGTGTYLTVKSVGDQ